MPYVSFASIFNEPSFDYGSFSGEDSTSTIEPSDYLNTLLRDPTSSHLLETIVLRSPDDAFAVLWSTYFRGKLARLAGHPVANFVLAKAMERVSADQLSEACVELEGSWSKMISTQLPLSHQISIP
jgi:nucleolar protein 9